MHRRDEIVVFFTILVIVERLAPGFEDRLTSELTTSLEYTGCFQEIQCIAEITIAELGDEF